VNPGDQLRARGVRSADGASFTADEVVTGAFRNIAGTISSVDAAAGTITVSDLATKKPEAVKVSPESQLRKLPPQMAADDCDAPEGCGGRHSSSGKLPCASGRTGDAPGGQGRNGGGDLPTIIGSTTVARLSEFQKGDVVMIVATSGPKDAQVMAITVLGGVEPLLQATTQEQASSILTPWSLSQWRRRRGA